MSCESPWTASRNAGGKFCDGLFVRGINYGIYWEDSSHGYRLYDWAGKTVTVQLRTPVVDDCAGDTTTTCSVSLGSSVTGDIELVADTDYFSLSVTSGVTYQIDAEGSETSMGTLDDPYLILRDASDSGLASDDDGGDGRNARIVWAASSTRTVYVEVNQVFHDSTGTYTLTVSVGPRGRLRQQYDHHLLRFAGDPRNRRYSIQWR